MKQYPTLTRSEAEPLIRSGELKKAFLYEPDHAPKGTRFVLVELIKGTKTLYRQYPKEA